MTATPDPDADLLAPALDGDRASFAALIERHYGRLHRIAWRLTGSSHDAEDIVQDVLCALVGKLTLFRGEARFSTWLIGILINACHDHRRRAGRLSRLRERFSVIAGLGARPDGRDLYRATWLASEIAKLSPEIRAAVVLVAGEGLSHAEAADLLGCAESTISWRLHEARKRLRAEQVEEVLDVR